MNKTVIKVPKQKRSKEELIEAAKAKDAKMDRSRKTPTKELKAAQLVNDMVNYSAPVPEYIQKIFDEPKEETVEWDVKIGDPIEFFDPLLSYELTGYRPLDETHSLDFDPTVFTIAAQTYRRTGRYTQLIPGTFKHRNHWIEEFKRCKDGYTVGKYRVTGEHYFFLNYYRLLSVLGDGKGGEVRNEDFPAFMAKLYEMFHYIEMARKTGHDALIFKCRGVGFSETVASILANGYTFHKASKSIVSAFAQNYVDATLAKTWQELDFLNTGTEGGFRRVRMKVDTSMKKRASKVDTDKNETGWMSEIEGIVTDNPRKLRGARVYNLCIDEAGSFPGLIDTYVQARALVDILGYRVGMRLLGGTGGDAGIGLEGLHKMFYNPEEYLILPYKNSYSSSGSISFTGFFIPSFTMWFGTKDQPGFDNRGVVYQERAKLYYTERWNKMKDPHLLLKDRAEYCFTPEDAFVLEGENRFDQDLLVEQYNNIVIHKTVSGPQSARLSWNIDKETGQLDKNKRPKIEFITDGPLKIVELPKLDDSGNVFTNLYCAAADAIDTDSTTSTGQTDVSKFCVVIYRRAFGIEPPKPVAIYIERPLHILTAFENALKLCSFYNCKMLVEATRISIKLYFEKEHMLHYLMRRPQATVNSSKKTNFKLYGVPATEAIIEHQLDLIEQYIVDYSTEIQFPEMLDELIRYSYANKRKFDIVAAFGIVLLADEDMIGKVAKTQHATVDNIINLSYYKNDYGLIEFGVRESKITRRLDSGNDMWTLW